MDLKETRQFCCCCYGIRDVIPSTTISKSSNDAFPPPLNASQFSTPNLHPSLLPGPCSWRSSSLPHLPVTSFRAPALMSHSSSGSSPEIGMGRVAALQSPARHISYSPGALLRAPHQICPSSRSPPVSPSSASPLQIFLTPPSVSTPPPPIVPPEVEPLVPRASVHRRDWSLEAQKD